ncbi:MAG: FG-GAP-like repeat-containing protein [Acidobacteriota bacterium]
MEHKFLGDTRARLLRSELAALDPAAPDVLKLELHIKLGDAELNLGRVQEAIENLSAAYRLLPNVEDKLNPGLANWVTCRLGIAYLRLGQAQNYNLRYSPDSYLLPIRDGGIHTFQEGSRKAIKYFTEVLQKTPEDSPAHLSTRWLINIAYMTLGAYPDRVPEAYLIPPEAFESDEPFPRFVNISQKVGLDTFSLSGGAVAEDFDHDGDIDLLVSSYDPAGQLRLFRNTQKRMFHDRTTEAGLLGLTGGLNMVQGDYDNDGDADVLVLRGAWLGKNGRHPNSLLRNNGDGTFTDVTFEAALGQVHYPTQTASWADYDNDGNLDLYIGNETTRDGLTSPSQLFHNNGDGTFTDFARDAGVTNLRFAKAVVWGDYDADRLPDLYVSNLRGSNRLYHNNGDGTFTDLAPRVGVTGPKASFPVWFWDFDNDGALDLFVSGYNVNIAHIAASYLGLPLGDIALPRLYRGDGRGGFEDVASQLNLRRPNAPMGCNFGDLDNDGYLDFYLGTGFPDYRELMPNVMYRNRQGESFADVTTAGGFGQLQKGHAVVFADLDNDGDQDIFEEMGGALPGDKFRDAVYENPGFGNHWITVELVGVQTNRSAIGARIRAVVITDGETRSIYKHVNSGATFGANPLPQTIGLGKADGIQLLEVFWPTSNRIQTFRRVPMDERVLIVETLDQLLTY